MKMLQIILLAALMLTCKHEMPVEPNPTGEILRPQWPMFGHGVHRTNNVNDEPFGAIVAPAGPVVSIDSVFEMGAALVGSPAISQNGVFFTSLLGVYKINNDGSLVWHIQTGEISGASAVGPDGIIYWCDGDYLNAVQPDGVLKWQLEECLGSYSPIVDRDGTIYYCHFDRGSAVAVKPDGTIKWEYADTRRIRFDSGVLDGDGTLYFLDSEGALYSLNKRGELKWRIPHVGSLNGRNVPAILPDHSIVVVTSTSLNVFSREGILVWERSVNQAKSPPIVDAKGNIIFGHWGGVPEVLSCYDANGNMRWQIRDLEGGSVIDGPSFDSDGNLYFGFSSGTVHCLYKVVKL